MTTPALQDPLELCERVRELARAFQAHHAAIFGDGFPVYPQGYDSLYRSVAAQLFSVSNDLHLRLAFDELEDAPQAAQQRTARRRGDND